MNSIWDRHYLFEDVEEVSVRAFSLEGAFMLLLHLQAPLCNLGDPCLQGNACRVNEMGHPIFPGEGDRMEGGNECKDFSDDDIEGPRCRSQAGPNHEEETSRLKDNRSASQPVDDKLFRKTRKRFM